MELIDDTQATSQTSFKFMTSNLIFSQKDPSYETYAYGQSKLSQFTPDSFFKNQEKSLGSD